MKIARLQAAGTMLAGVSCFAVQGCVAVGRYLGSSSDDWMTLAEVWQGSAWTAQQTPQATGSIVDDLQGVSCISQSECTAVGYYINGNGIGDSLGATLAEVWNGSAWTIEPTPNPKGLDVADLESVSCASSTACTAVGYFDKNNGNDKALAEVWNGSGWTLQPTVNPKTTTSSMSGVACPAQSECFAAGVYEAKFGPSQPLLEVHTITSWQQILAPVLEGAASSALHSVSCGSTNRCMAVGSYAVSTSTTATLAEYWNGTKWSIVPTPEVVGSSKSTLESVSCPTPDTCVAVGSETSSASSMGLVEDWDGKSWTIEQNPTQPGTSSGLTAVSCTSIEYCEAAGYYVLDSETFAFTEVWNGSVWSVDTVPLPPEGYDSELEGVSCSSPTACVAVGQYTQSAMLAALVERWNGSAWVLQSTPAIDGYLVGVSCPTSTACTAVGNSYSYPSGIAGSGGGVEWHEVEDRDHPSDREHRLRSTLRSGVPILDHLHGCWGLLRYRFREIGQLGRVESGVELDYRHDPQFRRPLHHGGGVGAIIQRSCCRREPDRRQRRLAHVCRGRDPLDRDRSSPHSCARSKTRSSALVRSAVENRSRRQTDSETQVSWSESSLWRPGSPLFLVGEVVPSAAAASGDIQRIREHGTVSARWGSGLLSGCEQAQRRFDNLLPKV